MGKAILTRVLRGLLQLLADLAVLSRLGRFLERARLLWIGILQRLRTLLEFLHDLLSLGGFLLLLVGERIDLRACVGRKFLAPFAIGTPRSLVGFARGLANLVGECV